MTYYLAIDIGASGGRHILGCVHQGKLTLEEVYRFENNIVNQDGSLIWDTERLTDEVINGIRACKVTGRLPKTIAIDTWGVDYVLMDKEGKEILPAYAYRDSRSGRVTKEVEQIVGPRRLYEITGIQKQDFNTIYQLYCDKLSGRLQKAERFLMMPEYLSYKLTGQMKNEYTNATTTGLINAEAHTWDTELLSALGIPGKLFESPCPPGTPVGRFTPEIRERVGFDAEIIFCPTHDTASAVAGCPMGEDSIYLSSGTWSLIGLESPAPILTDAAREANFTNEGGIGYRFRFLKNIMGMWLLQCIRRDLDKKYSYAEMVTIAEGSCFTKTVDVNAPEFVAPENMLKAIRAKLDEPDLPLPDVLNCVYHSLALSYAEAVAEMEAVTGRCFDSIHIVGGGCQNEYLNRLTRDYTGRKVCAGPVEATATGNILSQLIADNSAFGLEEARELVRQSFEIKEVSDRP